MKERKDILIKRVMVNGEEKDILLHDGIIKRIRDYGFFDKRSDFVDQRITGEDEAGIFKDIPQRDKVEVIDGKGLAVMPTFYNCHCHAAMTQLRGYADDMELFKWLNEYIWPKEATLTANDIYEGSKIAIREMVRSGTVFFADMYWMEEETERAAEEAGLRANIGITVMSRQTEEEQDRLFGKLKDWKPKTDRIQKSIAPHAIYTCEESLLRRCADAVEDLGVRCQIHLAETEKEVEDCKREHGGLTPVEYLERVGLLGEKTIAAHTIHLTENDAEILANTGTTCVHNPCSNMKLSSGAMNYPLLREKGARVALGTDGASSNNNLDMGEEMKTAALMAKLMYGPEVMPAQEALDMATRCGAEAFGIDGGVIEEGKVADMVLTDLDNDRMKPNHNVVSNYVYSADASVVKTVICDGRIIYSKQ